jgi:hypothetical protein
MTAFLSPSPLPARAALAAGVAARFFYWSGRSGRRYLFSCTAGARIGDFEEGVAMAVSGESIVWMGEVTALARMPLESAPRRAAIFLHLLAGSAEERRVVIEDLQPRREGYFQMAEYRRARPERSVAFAELPSSACA